MECDRKILQAVFDTLSAHIGDTDPHIEEDWTDDEIREEHPVFWAAKELAGILKRFNKSLSADQTGTDSANQTDVKSAPGPAPDLNVITQS